jgi:hypothetical protein
MEIHASLKILALKDELQKTDYKAIKYSEGWLTDEEYAETKAERQYIREEINRLEAELNRGLG